MRVLRSLAFALALVVPAASLADLSLSVDANAVAPSQSDSVGLGLGAGLGLDLMELGPLSLGPHVRIGSGGAANDLFWHGAAGARLTLDLILVMSATARVGVAGLDKAVRMGDGPGPESGTGALLETELAAEFPLLGPLTIGGRLGYSTILLRGVDYDWASYGLQLGLRI